MTDLLNPFNRSKTSNGRKAVVGETIVAEATETQRVDGYEYFAPEAVNWELLEPSSRTSVCSWKGVASYYDVVVDGTRYPAAAWTYKDPSDAAGSIKGHIAFWHGVRVAPRLS
jgi:uncharacterized protein (DUF427 family)